MELAHNAFQMSRTITEPVDIHKRYKTNDQDDPHARLIEFVYETGRTLFKAQQ